MARGRPLPGSRAVVGGLLVALSALGMFVAVSGRGDGPSTRYLVTTHDLAPGAIIRADDLALVAIDLPPAQAPRAVTDPDRAVGHFTVGPIARGSLVPVASIGRAGRDAIAVVTIAVESANGVGGALQGGDLVDAYVSYGSGTDSSTRRVLAGAEVVGVTDGSGAVGDAGQLEVTLEVPDPRVRIDLVNASHAGTVTLARVVGRSTPSADAGASRFAEQGDDADDATRTPSTTEPSS